MTRHASQHEAGGKPGAEVAPRPSGKGMPDTWRARAPDADATAFLRMLNLATRIRPIERYSLGEMRQLWRLTALALGSQPSVHAVSERHIEGPGGPLVLRIFKPCQSAEPLPAFLWCHGGGFVVGGLDTAESICRNLALQAHCITVAVGYRLAPEHDLQAGREDVLAALQWLAEHGAELGIDSSRLAIGGDSAGGNLAAAVAQEVQRRKGPKLALQILVYPATDLIQAFPSLTENAQGYMVTDQVLGQIQQVTAAAIASLDPADPWLSPRRSPNLRGLCPALVISAGFDPIRDDGLDYSSRLRAAGVPVELLHYAGQFHGFINFDALLDAAADALARMAQALERAFADAPACDRTLEIADAPEDAQPLKATTQTLLAIWSASGGWRDALLRQLSPRLACLARALLRPWLAPANLLHHHLDERLARLVANQTYPESP